MCVPALSLNVKFPPADVPRVSSGLWKLDIDYLKTKTRVHRSKHTAEMDDRESRYFEAMGTMLDIVDYACLYVFEDIKAVNMVVDPDNNKSVIEAKFSYRYATVTVIGSYEITDDAPLGAFGIDMSMERYGGIVGDVHVTTVPADQALCYTENFPIPSVLIGTLTNAAAQLKGSI